MGPNQVSESEQGGPEAIISASSLYGIQTARAILNFPVSGPKLRDIGAYVRAFADIKRAAARTNAELGVLRPDISAALEKACEEMRSGLLSNHLVVPLMEGSGGTSLNMNVNEVLANRAIQILQTTADSTETIHPNDHVNRGQSTNDVVPSAIQLACVDLIDQLSSAMLEFALATEQKSNEFRTVLKTGRTCLQDAQPMTLGQGFSAYSAFARRASEQLQRNRLDLLELPLGATAIGTGFGTTDEYSERVYRRLSVISGYDVRPANNLFDAMSNADGLVRLAGELAAIGTGFGKIANDLILLSSGPATGLAEIKLPECQAGSSIMPGKVNPVIPMFVRQICHKVSGNVSTIGAASADGMLEINHYEGVMATALFECFDLLLSASKQLTERCISGIKANEDHMRERLISSSAIATALCEQIGYAAVSDLVKEAGATGVSFADLIIAKGLMSAVDLEHRLHASVGLQ